MSDTQEFMNKIESAMKAGEVFIETIGWDDMYRLTVNPDGSAFCGEFDLKERVFRLAALLSKSLTGFLPTFVMTPMQTQMKVEQPLLSSRTSKLETWFSMTTGLTRALASPLSLALTTRSRLPLSSTLPERPGWRLRTTRLNACGSLRFFGVPTGILRTSRGLREWQGGVSLY